MWDQVKRTDVELARQKLVELRNMTLERHAEELKQLDADEIEIETLGRLVEGFTEKYLNGRTRTAEEPTPAIQDAAASRIEQEEAHPAILEVSQNVSPNFGGPLRRLVGR